MPTPTRVLKEVRRFIEAARPVADSDRALLDQFVRTRDDRAFAELVRRHGPMVLGVCRRALRHSADADDAFQATFLILVRRAADVRDPDRLGSWLYGVAWRTANKLRSMRRPDLPLPDEIPANVSSPDWPVELDAAIARLPEKYRTPVVLCHLQGLSPNEVASRLGCAPATIVTRLFRARQTLRRRLTALGLAVPPALVAGSVLEVPSALATAVGAMAAGRTISPAAARLADGVFRSLLMTKIRWATTAAVVCLGGVGLLGFRAGGQEPVAPPPIELAVPDTRQPVIPPPASPDMAPAERVEEKFSVTTTNFHVSAPSMRIARLIGDAAERARKDVAVTWLGKELDPWPKPWTIHAYVSKGTAGATTFNFNDKPLRGDMRVEGELDRLLTDVVPHEVTHCVMAQVFQAPVPRWADEGISLLSESEEEQNKHAQLTRDRMNSGSLLQLKVLFALKEYPANEILGFFAQSYSVTRFLVGKRDNNTFLRFVADGMKNGWEPAAKTHYEFASLNDLEREFLNSLGSGTQASSLLANRGTPSNPTLIIAEADEAGKIFLGSPAIRSQPTTNYVPRTTTVKIEPDGKPMPQTYYAPVTTYKVIRDFSACPSIAASDINAITADGKPLETAKLLALLRGKPTPVVVASDWERTGKLFAALLKPETIILMRPSPKSAAPETTPRP